MSLMSALKKIFSRPYEKVSAADAAALAERARVPEETEN